MRVASLIHTTYREGGKEGRREGGKKRRKEGRQGERKDGIDSRLIGSCSNQNMVHKICLIPEQHCQFRVVQIFQIYSL